MNKVVEENKIAQQNVLKSFCTRFLGQESIIIKPEDIDFIKGCLRKIATYEKNILDEQYESSKENELDFGFEEMQDNMLGYFSKAHGNCFIRLRDNMYGPVLYSRDKLASTFLSQLNTVFHEFNHFEQVLKMKSDKYVSYTNYRMAQENVVKSRRIYKDNYWNMLLEMESRLAGKRRVEELVKNLGDNYEFKDLLEQNKRVTDKEGYIENVHEVAPKLIHKEGFQESEAVRNQLLHERIARRPQYLKEYPILKYRYNEDGSRKKILDIVNDLSEYANDGEKIKILIETLTEAVEEATIDELKEVEATYPGSASYIYEFLYDENEIRFKQEKEMIRNLKEQNLFPGTENDKFIDQNLEQILESKYKRRFEMLEMYQDGRYEEGYELINYNLQKGVDVPLREDNVSDVENSIRHLFVREKFIDVYNKTESEIDFKNREFNEDAKISYVLNTVATGKIPSRLLRRVARPFTKFTRNNFKELATVFKVAEDLTLPGGKNYVTELYSIPDVQKIAEKMFESDVYQELVEESKLSSQPERKTQLDLDYEIADEHLRYLESPESELSEFVTNDIPTIGENAPEADKAMWKITTIQKGYSVSVEDGDLVRSKEPVYLKSRRDLVMENAVREAVRRNVSFDQVQGVNFKEEQTQDKEGVDQDD